MKRFWICALAALALCLTFPGVRGGAEAAYVQECGIALPPVVISDYRVGLDQADRPPATVFFRLDEELRLPDGTDAEEALEELNGAAVPVFYVQDQAAADRVAEFVSGRNLIECLVASDDAALVASMRAVCTRVQGLWDARGSTAGPQELRDTANSSDAKVVLVDAQWTAYEPVRWLQERLMTVWCEAETEEEIYAAAVSGANGIWTSDPDLAYDLLTSFDEGSLLHFPMVVGHRGMYNEKQNTLASAQEAFRAGADAVECDIYLSADGRIVLSHDQTLDNTTTGTGDVEQMTWAEISQYEVDYGGGGENRPIALLDDLFGAFKDTDLVHFVEIKSSRPEIVPALKALIEEYDVSGQVVVISFLSEQLARVHEQIPELSVGLLTNTAQGYDAMAANIALAPLNATLNPSYEFVTLDQISQLAACGLTVWSWTYPNGGAYDQAWQNGINGITTDYADRASDRVVRLEASDFAVGSRDSEAVPLTAVAVTQKGERFEVSCDYMQISGSMTLLQTSEGKYYAGRGTAVVLLKYRFESDDVAYTVWSDPVTVTVEESSDGGGGCGASAVLGSVCAALGLALSGLSLVFLKRRA